MGRLRESRLFGRVLRFTDRILDALRRIVYEATGPVRLRHRMRKESDGDFYLVHRRSVCVVKRVYSSTSLEDLASCSATIYRTSNMLLYSDRCVVLRPAG
jgi:hypothetical protein